MIVDSQVHLWSTGVPSPIHTVGAVFRAADLLARMDSAGVDRAVIVPPMWAAPDDPEIEAARSRHADRLMVMAGPTVEAARAVGGALRPMRLIFAKQLGRPLDADDGLDGLWDEAEAAGTPVMVFASDALPAVGRLAEGRPGLKLCVDHFGLDTAARDEAALANLPDLLALARRPNVSVKLSALPCYSTQAYPHANLHQAIRRAFDAFGPRRCFWGSDMTRLPGTYRECVAMFDQALPWLSGEDKRLVMGEALLDWLEWPR